MEDWNTSVDLKMDKEDAANLSENHSLIILIKDFIVILSQAHG